MSAAEGVGLTITFGTSSFSANIIEVSGSGNFQRAKIDATHLGSSTAMQYILASLYDPGDVTLKIQWNGDQVPPTDGVAETITITPPLPSGQSTAGTLVFSAGVTGFPFSVPRAGELMTADVQLGILGAITITPSS
jgi:hypothetical protein